MKILNFKNKNSGFTRIKLKGFTLLETLIAIFVMTVAFTALVTLMSTSLFSARYAKNEITATYLIQEAVDYIRNDRDTTAFKADDWYTSGATSFLGHYGYMPGTPSACFANDGCIIDASNLDPTTSVSQCGPSGCMNLLYDKDATNGAYYTYTSSSVTVESNFRRTITMETSNGGEELDVTVKVAWRNGSINRSQTLHFSLLKWQ